MNSIGHPVVFLLASPGDKRLHVVLMSMSRSLLSPSDCRLCVHLVLVSDDCVLYDPMYAYRRSIHILSSTARGRSPRCHTPQDVARPLYPSPVLTFPPIPPCGKDTPFSVVQLSRFRLTRLTADAPFGRCNRRVPRSRDPVVPRRHMPPRYGYICWRRRLLVT